MTTNERGLEIITSFEGYRANWYDDGVGVQTIGFGHTGKLPSGFHAPLSAEEALTLLVDHDLPRYEQAVAEAVKVPVSEAEFSALVSLCFNIGINAFKDSTLLRMLNRGDYNGAAFQFEKWVYAGGRRMVGLEKRREAEKKLFLSSRPADRKQIKGPYECRNPYVEALKQVKPLPSEPIPITNPKSISSKLVGGEPTEPIPLNSKDRPAAA